MDTTTTTSVEKTTKPQWLRVKLPTGKKYTELRSLVDKYQLNTICTSGSCPNMLGTWYRYFYDVGKYLYTLLRLLWGKNRAS